MMNPPITGWFAQPAVAVIPPVTLPPLPTVTPSGKTSLTPLEVAAAYQLPEGDGTGVTIGVISLIGALNPGVFNAYCGLLGVIPPTITNVSVNGGVPTSSSNDAEASLDMAVLGVLVPRANFRIYYTPDNSNASFLAAVTQALIECDLVSSSYGNSDFYVTLATAQSFELALRQARTRGVSYFNASGDNGSDSGSISGFETPTATSFPVNCPSTVSVGATAPTITAGVVTAETGMNISGGGVSRVFPSVSAPVVSCFGDYTQGYPVALSNATWSNYSSTSGSTPFMAAVHARLIQAYGKRFDFMDFALLNPQAFNDITTGTNGAYTATIGRDNVTGIGTPKGTALLSALASYQPSIIIDGSST